MRRAVFASIGIAVVALAVTAVIGHVLAGVGLGIGLGIGLANVRLVTRSVSKVAALDLPRPKRAIATRAVTRLIATTVIVIGLVIASTTLGIATAGGIALFYFVLVIGLARALLGSMRSGVVA
jgi:hypothetical protein